VTAIVGKAEPTAAVAAVNWRIRQKLMLQMLLPLMGITFIHLLLRLLLQLLPQQRQLIHNTPQL
jgi:hypothetical protein